MPNDGPAWFDRVMGCFSPPFTFRNGGSAIIAGPKSGAQADEPRLTHFSKQAHDDCAKDKAAALEIVGEGPATASPAEDGP
jgi:hypothetical protein